MKKLAVILLLVTASCTQTSSKPKEESMHVAPYTYYDCMIYVKSEQFCRDTSSR